ncbi:Golgi to plasma membrane transport vesicle coat protein [Rutstroemia sp. NJR-2017a BBW]|nr:Golgi to plasma membrane transport vesicle coat protein [Rutstroemia sp. NJR-2017a BBW]
MVTEALPVGCTSCPEKAESTTSRRPSTSRSLKSSDSPNPSRPAYRVESTVSDTELGGSTSTTSSAAETPPDSPRVAALQTAQNANQLRRDSSFRKTYSEKPGPCENCALTLPKKAKEESPTSPKIPPVGNGTRKPYERVALQQDEPSPPKSPPSDSDESEPTLRTGPQLQRPAEPNRTVTSSSYTSFQSTIAHNHFIDYTSTHEPLHPTSFSIIRQSCLRTLSCETLPPSSNSTSNSTPTSPFLSSFPSHITSSTTTSIGGPIFFGDPLAGYTTAYIFRIPDPTARGRRRVYALIALSTHKERLAMRTFSFLDAAFRDLAEWIQRLADDELQRSESALQSPRPGASNQGTPTSSFLRGGSRGADGRMMGASLKGRGLAELVGLPDFFMELHVRFVRLLAEIEMKLAS